MTRSKLLPALAVTVALLALGACGSDSQAPATDPETSATTPATTSEPSTPPAEAPTTPEPTDETTTAQPTKAAPTGKLLDYENGDDDGATITTAADTTKLTGAPADFKAFIGARLSSADAGEGCTEAPQIYVARVDTGGWARGGYFIPQCGGYAALWAKSGGAWTEVWSGQSLVECATLTKYKVPARVAGAQCLEGEDAVDYAA